MRVPDVQTAVTMDTGVFIFCVRVLNVYVICQVDRGVVIQ